MNLEKFNFVKDGAMIRLPPGFRFQPTDEEIVFQYLLRKTFSCPLPASIIPDHHLNVSNLNPSDLPGDPEQDRYFFSNKELKYKNGNNRATQGGYWKPTGLDKQIASSKRKPIVGKRKTLVFYEGKPPHGIRTNWIMHEYRLILSRDADRACSPQISTIQIGHWVICHIFLKKRSNKSAGVEMINENNHDYKAASCETADVACDYSTRVDEYDDHVIEAADSTSMSSSVASDSSVITHEVSSNCNEYL